MQPVYHRRFLWRGAGVEIRDVDNPDAAALVRNALGNPLPQCLVTGRWP
jgi:hypothetical protein